MPEAHDVLLHHVAPLDLAVAVDPAAPAAFRQVLDTWATSLRSDEGSRTVVLTSAPDAREVAEALARWIGEVQPSMSVVVAPPLERGDEVVPYLRRRVLPTIEALRSAVVAADRRRWRDRFSLTVSPGAGTPTWVSGLLAATRSLRPASIFVDGPSPRLHAFQEVDQVPPVGADGLEDADVRRIVEEMCRWRDEYLSATQAQREHGEDELYEFWLRKGRRSVLSVLLVDVGRGPELYRGCNLEVSLPTGTLCAERNAIGTALAAHPDLKRHQVQMVAVLSLGGPGEVDGTGGNPIGPCGACREWLLKMDERNPDLRVVTFTDRGCAEVIVQSLAQVPW